MDPTAGNVDNKIDGDFSLGCFFRPIVGVAIYKLENAQCEYSIIPNNWLSIHFPRYIILHIRRKYLSLLSRVFSDCDI